MAKNALWRFMNIDFLGMFKVWIESPDSRFYPIIFVIFILFVIFGWRAY